MVENENKGINKGIANAQDEEYLQYRNYVNLCKEQSALYYVGA